MENSPERNDDFIEPHKVVEEVRQCPDRWQMGLGILNPQLARMRRVIDDTRIRLAELEAEGRGTDAKRFHEHLENFLGREREYADAIEEIRQIGEKYRRSEH